MQKLCRFCLKSCGKNIKMIDEIIFEIMDILLLKLNLKITLNPAMCKECTECLQRCFSFKSTCFYTEEYIFSYINQNDNTCIKLNLREIYMSAQNLTELVLPVNQKMCRFCMGLMADDLSISLFHVDEDILQKCLPELNFFSVCDPVICPACSESLKVYANFMDVCTQTEQKTDRFKELRGTNMRGLVALNNVLKFSLEDQFDSTEDIETKFIKVPDTETVKPEKIHYGELIHRQENILENGKIEYKAKSKGVIKYQYTEEEMKRRKFACSLCSFRTTMKQTLTTHNFQHTGFPDKPKYSCDICTYKTRDQHHLTRHIKTHYKEPKKIIFKKCPHCDYRSRHACSVKTHAVNVHGNPAQWKQFRCDYCPYKAKYKASLTSHLRKHNADYAYKCEQCPFQTKYIESFRKHCRQHKDPHELEFLRCAKCAFKTMRKGQLRIHIQQAHTDPSVTVKFNCEDCPYTTFYKGDLRKHRVKHKDRSEVTIYKCGECSYEALEKKVLRYHERNVHKDRSEITMYKCAICPYEGKYAELLKRHAYKHKDPSEVERFVCAECGQPFLDKCNLKSHLKKHRMKNMKKRIKVCKE